MFVADESVQAGVINLLRENEFNVYSIQENHQGIADQEVLQITYSRNEILITEDKDFDELAFRQKEPHKGIILLRLYDLKPNIRPQMVLSAIKRFSDKLYGNFIVISSDKIRVRKLVL